MAGLELKRLSDFDAYKVNLRVFHISGLAVAQQITNIDYKLTEERLIYGGFAILKGHNIDDVIKYQVVDVDNILGFGSNVVLNEFIDIAVCEDSQKQETIMCGYPSKVPAGLYIRIVYNSTGQQDVKVKANILAVKNITGE